MREGWIAWEETNPGGAEGHETEARLSEIDKGAEGLEDVQEGRETERHVGEIQVLK